METIKKYRKLCGLSQKELADLCSVHQTAVSQWEKGRTTPDIESLKKIAKALKVSTEALLEIEPHVSENKIPGFSAINAEAAEKLGENEMFALTVTGDEMSPTLVPHDTVIVDRTVMPDGGEIAAVSIGNENAIITRIIKKSTSILLVPENPNYEPLVFSLGEFKSLPVTVLGKVIELRRKL